MKTIQSLLFLFFLIGALPHSLAQETEKEELLQSPLIILSKSYKDSIVLRWAPQEPAVWSANNKKGYKLRKITYSKEGRTDTIVLADGIKPMPLERMKETASREDKYVAIMAQALYGKTFLMGNNPPQNGFEAIQQGHDAFQMRFMFALLSADLSKEAAQLGGLRYVDKNVKEGEMYSYLISSDTMVFNTKIITGKTTIMNGAGVQEVPEGLYAIPHDQMIELRWFRNQPGRYSMYDIERSEDRGRTWKKLNPEPFGVTYDPKLDDSDDARVRATNEIIRDFQMLYDSIPENYKEYQYRVKGYDAFADLSESSKVVTAHGIDQIPPAQARITKTENIEENHIQITWIKDKIEPDFKGFYVQKAMDINGPYLPIHDGFLSSSTTSIIDREATALAPNYYTVVAIDTAGNEAVSFPKQGLLKDSIPPLPPTQLAGVMDTLGHVFLSWKQNEEPDLKGYKVYSSYSKNGDYLQVTRVQLSENGYIDTISLKSLDRKVYYKVVAIDKNGNHSDYSEPVAIRKSKAFPPSAPTPKKIYQEGDAIVTQWNGSGSEEVAGYLIYRSENKAEYQLMGFVPTKESGEDFSYVDTNIVYKQNYSYTALTLDSTDLHSELSTPVEIIGNSAKKNILKKVQDLKTEQLSGSSSIKLTWSYSKNENFFFVIYRSEGEELPEIWEFVEGNSSQYVDSRTKKGVKYSYSVVVKNRENNTQSLPSDSASIVTK